MSVVLCYGDSNTHGTPPIVTLGDSARFGAQDRWPDVMARHLGPAHQVLTEGLGGRTTVHDDPIEGAMRNGLMVLPAVLHSHKPLDLVVIMLGTNDLKNRFSVTAFEIARSVERLGQLTQAELPGTDVMLVAPAPVRETGSLVDVFHGAEARQNGLAQHVRRVASENRWGFVEAGAHIAVSDIDGVHWASEAHHSFGQVMAGAVVDRLG